MVRLAHVAGGGFVRQSDRWFAGGITFAVRFTEGDAAGVAASIAPSSQVPATGADADRICISSVDDHDLTNPSDDIFIEVTIGDHSDFENRVDERGDAHHGRYRVLAAPGESVPNTLASILLDIRDRTGIRPRIHVDLTEGNPALHLLRFLLFGVGEVAPVTREVLRRAD